MDDEPGGKLNADDRNLIAVLAMLIAVIAIVLVFLYARQLLA